MRQGVQGEVVRRLDGLFDRGTTAGMSECELLERFLVQRDEHAFEALVARHGPMVFGVCRRLLSDSHAVDDAFQATFLLLVRKGCSIRDGRCLGAWLHGVAVKTARRARAGAWRRAQVERKVSVSEELALSGESWPSELERTEYRAALDEELSRLPEKYRAPILLCYYEGLTHDEAASRLDWPVGTVRGRLARARERLRGRLLRRGVSLPAAFGAAALGATTAKAGLSPAVPGKLLEPVLALARLGIDGSVPGMIPGVVSRSVWTLGEDVSRSMFMAKLTTTALAVAAAGLIGTGAAAVRAVQDSGAASPEAIPVTAPAPAAPTPAPDQPSPVIAVPIPPPVQPGPNATVPPAYVATPIPAAPAFAPVATPSPPIAAFPTPTDPFGAQATPPAAAPSPTPVPSASPRYTGQPPAGYGLAPPANVPAGPARPRAIATTTPVPASEADWAAYLERTKRDVTSALENITQEEAKLEERLKSLRATRVRLQAMQRAFAETPVERTGFFIPDVDPLAAEAHVGEPSPIEEIAPPEPAPASLVPSLPEPEAHSANVALLPEIEGGESRIEKLEAKVDELMSVLKKLSAQVEAAGQAK